MKLIEQYCNGAKSVIDLGAQNNYTGPKLPAPYMREWWEARGVEYDSIDLSGECGAFAWDLSKPLPTDKQYDAVGDWGTGEHIGTTIEDYYQCWLNKWALCKDGGIIISENPMKGNWPGHGRHYLGKDFYAHVRVGVLDFGMHPAMGNTKDGWNVWGVIRKDHRAAFREQFITLEEFKQLPIFPR